MNPLDIKMAFLKADIAIHQFARQEGYSHTALVLYDPVIHKGFRVREAVARVIGKNIKEIWLLEPQAI